MLIVPYEGPCSIFVARLHVLNFPWMLAAFKQQVKHVILYERGKQSRKISYPPTKPN